MSPPDEPGSQRARAATVTFGVVDPSSPSARAATGRYFAELERRFAFDAAGLDERDAAALRAPTGAFVVAEDGGSPIACGGVQSIGVAVGEVKRMWVDAGWRGAGLGSRLLVHLEGAAWALGHRTLRLDTNAALVEAIALYARCGYHPIGRYNDNPHATHFFEKRLTSNLRPR